MRVSRLRAAFPSPSGRTHSTGIGALTLAELLRAPAESLTTSEASYVDPGAYVCLTVGTVVTDFLPSPNVQSQWAIVRPVTGVEEPLPSKLADVPLTVGLGSTAVGQPVTVTDSGTVTVAELWDVNEELPDAVPQSTGSARIVYVWPAGPLSSWLDWPSTWNEKLLRAYETVPSANREVPSVVIWKATGGGASPDGCGIVTSETVDVLKQGYGDTHNVTSSVTS